MPELIREQDPLKQGLKPGKLSVNLHGAGHSRARSIKTRIETELQYGTQQCSIIREQDPLKQGLKQYFTLFRAPSMIVFASKIH